MSVDRRRRPRRRRGCDGAHSDRRRRRAERLRRGAGAGGPGLWPGGGALGRGGAAGPAARRVRGDPARPAHAGHGRLRDRPPDPAETAQQLDSDRLPDRHLPRRGPRLPGLLGRGRRRGVQAGGPVHPAVQGQCAGRPLSEDRGGQAPGCRGAPAAGRERAGDGREGQGRARAGALAPARGDDPEVAADRLPLARGYSALCAVLRQRQHPGDHRLCGRAVRRRAGLRRQPRPSRRPAARGRRPRLGRPPRGLRLRISLAVRGRPVPLPARPGRSGAPARPRISRRSSASSSTPPSAARWRSNSPRPARWRRSAS
jgi:hypothetical protein